MGMDADLCAKGHRKTPQSWKQNSQGKYWCLVCHRERMRFRRAKAARERRLLIEHERIERQVAANLGRMEVQPIVVPFGAQQRVRDPNAPPGDPAGEWLPF